MPDLVSHPDEVRVVSQRFGQGAADIDRYIELDGYKALQKALALGADGIINEVKASNLRGRGGAGFPTGMKWSFVPKESPKPKYVLCNGDESEPGIARRIGMPPATLASNPIGRFREAARAKSSSPCSASR